MRRRGGFTTAVALRRKAKGSAHAALLGSRRAYAQRFPLLWPKSHKPAASLTIEYQNEKERVRPSLNVRSSLLRASIRQEPGGARRCMHVGGEAARMPPRTPELRVCRRPRCVHQ